jgi:hypothetical protein
MVMPWCSGIITLYKWGCIPIACIEGLPGQYYRQQKHILAVWHVEETRNAWILLVQVKFSRSSFLVRKLWQEPQPKEWL